MLPPPSLEFDVCRLQDTLDQLAFATYDPDPQSIITTELQEAGRTQSALAGLVNQALLGRFLPPGQRADLVSRCLRTLLMGSASPAASALGDLPTRTSSTLANNPT